MEHDETVHLVAARLAADPELADTVMKRSGATIEPTHKACDLATFALGELRRVGGSLAEKIAFHGLIGEGGMGAVHLATQSTLGRHVAVKTLRSNAEDVDATLRILREAWVTGLLSHPNIVPVYDVGVDASGSPIIVMKRVEGRPWSEVMHEPLALTQLTGRADPLEANIHVLVSVCNAIHFAHSRGILHRDIKPDNVMIGAFGEVYLLDWGIAVSLHDDPSGRLPLASEAHEIAGTPNYMAPEMLLGDPQKLSPRTDVYLLGAVLYEIFAKVPPHKGSSLESMVASIVLSTPRFEKGFPVEARAICEKAMGRNPSDRFESAEAVRSALEDYIRHRGSRRLAADAKQSQRELLRTLAEDPPSEERTLAVFNLLGECRFGYRAALSAWPENGAAKRGLDRALASVIEYEVAGGDPNAALALLREMSAPETSLVERVESAVQKRAGEDERLRQLSVDHDPSIGTRTRMLIGGAFGVIWTTFPLGLWWLSRGNAGPAHWVVALGSVAFLLFGVALYVWARETLNKTLLNRRLTLTVGLTFLMQLLLGLGAFLMNLSPQQESAFLVLCWCLIHVSLAIWVERWFAVPAFFTAISFLLISVQPTMAYPIMSVDNAILTLIVIFVWFPKQDVETLRKRREELRASARHMFLSRARSPQNSVESEDDVA